MSVLVNLLPLNFRGLDIQQEIKLNVLTMSDARKEMFKNIEERERNVTDEPSRIRKFMSAVIPGIEQAEELESDEESK